MLTQLANQAKATVPSVTSSGFTVSTTVSSNVTTGNTPLATINAGLTALAASLPAPLQTAAAGMQTNAASLQTSVIQTASTQLSSAQTTNGGAVAAPSTAVQDGIAAAKALLAGMKANLQTFANPQQTGFLQMQSTALQNDANGVALTGTYNFVDIVKASQRATALLVETNRARATGTAVVNATSGTDTFGDFYLRVMTDDAGLPWKCKAYYTAGTNVIPSDNSAARTPPVSGNSGNPVAICNYFLYADGLREMQFIVKSPAAPGSVASGATLPYVNRLRVWANPACVSAVTSSCLFTDTNQVTGNLTATWDSSAVVSGVTITAGSIVPYIPGTTNSTIDLAYTGSKVGFVNTLNFSGTLTSGALKYGFLSGSSATITDTSNGAGTSGTVAVNLLGRISTSAFQYDGTFNVSGNSSTPDLGSFGLTGSISTLSNGTATKFLEGTLAANGTAKTIAFTGKVTNSTNGTNVTSIALDSNAATTGQQTASLTFITGAYSFNASGTSYDNPMTASTMNVTASDGTKVAVTRQNGSSTVVVKNSAGTQIGSMTGNQVNFSDNTYITLN